MSKSIILSMSLLFTMSLLGQNQSKFRKLDSLFNYLEQNDKFMGSVAIRENDKVVFEKSYGFADLDLKRNANSNTKYKVGSITKTFTASIIFQLIDQNKLALETNLSKFYPEIKNAERITIGQMLNHKSGIFNFTNEDDFIKFASQSKTKQEMVSKIASFDAAFEPDSKADYSNSNYLLLGYIIEKITGKTYQENVKQRIIDKIGLKNTSYYDVINSAENEAFSYNYNSDKKLEKIDQWSATQVGGAGALESTPDDLTKFTNALFSGKIISKNALDEMTKIDQGFGKGIFTAPFGDRTFYTHNGGIEGFTASYGYNPEENVGFSILLNFDNYSMNDMTVGLLKIYYDKPYEFPQFKSVAVSRDLLKKYEGIYSAENFPPKIIIKVENNMLTGQVSGQSAFPLTSVSETEFNFEKAHVTINFKENGFEFKQGGKTIEFTKD